VTILYTISVRTWKHVTSPLQNPNGYCSLGKQSLLLVRTIRNTQIYCEQTVPHRKHHVTTTKPNRLMLLRERVAVCCENRTDHTVNRLYLTRNISRLRYGAQSVNAVWRNSRCLLSELYRTRRCSLLGEYGGFGGLMVLIISDEERNYEVHYLVKWASCLFMKCSDLTQLR
jgi:hypothetical protein